VYERIVLNLRNGITRIVLRGSPIIRGEKILKGSVHTAIAWDVYNTIH
jgi:hypothetical protein